VTEAIQFLPNRRWGHVIVSPLAMAATRTRLLAAEASAWLPLAPTITHALIDAAMDFGLSLTASIDRLRIWLPEIVKAA
jgi:hypothetical protein